MTEATTSSAPAASAASATEQATEQAAPPDAYTEAAVAEASAARGEPDWLRARRVEGARAFAAMPMPSPTLRPWKYTDITALDLAAFPASGASGATITVSGGPSDSPSDGASADTRPGGFAGTLARGVREREEIVRTHLGSVVTATEGKFAAANAARWSEGALVYVPRGVVFDAPVLVEVDARTADAAAVFPRVLVVAEEGAEASVVLRLLSGDAPLLAPCVIEVIAGPAANVRIVIDGRWGTATQEFTTVRSRLERDASVSVSSIAVGGALVKQTMEALLEGEGSHSTIHGVALGDGEQHFDFVTLQDHSAPRTVSEVEIRAALAGAARSVYYGITHVGEGAAGAQANQQNRNLLLSPQAKADSDPVLEILTADVIRCGHGATVGPVDEGVLFYLQSRGLDRRAALQLIVYGFLRAVADEVALPDGAEELYETVTRKLATARL